MGEALPKNGYLYPAGGTVHINMVEISQVEVQKV